jgi:hypothetical protein
MRRVLAAEDGWLGLRLLFLRFALADEAVDAHASLVVLALALLEHSMNYYCQYVYSDQVKFVGSS